MSSWQRWIHSPHTLLLRRALFQVHLWAGIGLGLYLFFISITGSAVVLRPEFSRWFIEDRVFPSEAGPFEGEVLEQMIAEEYSGYTVLAINPPRFRSQATYVLLEREGKESSRYFNQYTGLDQGLTYPWQVKTMESLVRLHDELWLDSLGRKINGVGGALLILMVLSGLVIWWQGRKRWIGGIQIKRNSRRSFVWQLHSVVGFWSLLLLFCWGLSAVYFAFPEPFEKLMDLFDKDLEDFERPDSWLLFILKIHFGRFGGLWGRITWIVLGLLPAVMFATGFILWWKRVVKVKC